MKFESGLERLGSWRTGGLVGRQTGRLAGGQLEQRRAIFLDGGSFVAGSGVAAALSGVFLGLVRSRRIEL